MRSPVPAECRFLACISKCPVCVGGRERESISVGMGEGKCWNECGFGMSEGESVNVKKGGARKQ